MSGFANPIVNAAGTLIRTLMKSANFVAGLAGWQITKAGDAEFNGGVFRGIVKVTSANNSEVDIDPGGIPLNANPYFETDVSNWTASGGAVIARSTISHQGTGSMIITPNAIGTPSIGSEDFPVVPLRSYLLSAWGQSPDNGVPRTVNIVWKDAAHAVISTVTISVNMANQNVWYQFTTPAVSAPSNAAFGQVTTAGNAGVNSQWIVDEIKLTSLIGGVVRVLGPNGSVISIDASQPYPTMFFYSIDGTNYSQLSLINYASNSAADFWISSGQWTPADGVPRATRLFMAGAQSNLVYLAVARVSDGAVYGGSYELNGTVGAVGFRTPANVTNLYNRLSFDANGAQLIIAGILEIFNTATIQFDGGTTLRMKQGASLRREGGTSTAGDVGKGVVNYSITNSASINTTAGAPFSAKILVGSMAGFVVEADRAYAVQIIGGFQSSTAACSPNFYLHTGIASGAGAILWDWLWGDQAQGDVRSAPSGLGYFRRVGGGGTIDISLQMLTNGSGAGNHYADANHKRGFIVYDVGIANDFPWATNV